MDALVAMRCETDIASKRFFKNLVKTNTVSERLKTKDDNNEQVPEEQLIQEVLDECERGNSRISDVLAVFEKFSSLPVFEIDGNRCLRPALSSINENLQIYLPGNVRLTKNWVFVLTLFHIA